MIGMAVQQTGSKGIGVETNTGKSALELLCNVENVLNNYVSFLETKFKDVNKANVVVSQIKKNYQGIVMFKNPKSDEFILVPMFSVETKDNNGTKIIDYRVICNNELYPYKLPDISNLNFNPDRKYG